MLPNMSLFISVSGKLLCVAMLWLENQTFSRLKHTSTKYDIYADASKAPGFGANDVLCLVFVRQCCLQALQLFWMLTRLTRRGAIHMLSTLMVYRFTRSHTRYHTAPYDTARPTKANTADVEFYIAETTVVKIKWRRVVIKTRLTIPVLVCRLSSTS